MQKKIILSYLFILVTLLGFLSLSRPASEKLRGNFVAFLSPLWNSITSLTTDLKQSSQEVIKVENSSISLSPQEEIQRLQLTNKLLTNEFLNFSLLLDEKQKIDALLQQQQASSLDLEKSHADYQKYIQHLKQNLTLRIQAIPARVIFRSMDTWNNSLWINVGEADNEVFHSTIIAKDSPVLIGNSLIGVIDYVGPHQSRICLITNPKLVPSVRAVRGGEQEAALGEHVDIILQVLNRKNTILIADTERDSLIQSLGKLKATLNPTKKSLYLAKGELKGKLRPLSHSQNQILKGTGFNYDFPDEESDIRDLRTGKLLNKEEDISIPLLKINDLLITTGMDGIFPPNLNVASITKIEPLKEGDYYYDLEAVPTAGDLNNISVVFVIPPVGYDSNEKN